MNKFKFGFTTLAAMLLTLTSLSAAADEVSDRVAAALANPARDQEDSARDESRKPAEVMAFVGIKTGMTVLDAYSSTGWYAEALAAAVGPTGKVYAQNPARFAERSAPAQALKIARFPNIIPVTAENAAGYGLNGQVDAAWTALNLHDNANASHEAGVEFLKAIYNSMKPGAVLGMIDHEGSPGMDNKALHRVDVETAVSLLKEAGFVVEAQSDVLNNPADDHSLNSHAEELGRNTDRFVIRARKPAM